MKPDIDITSSAKNEFSNDKIALLTGYLSSSVFIIYFLANREWHRVTPVPFFIIIAIILLQEMFLLLPATKNNKFFNTEGPAPAFVYNVSVLLAFVFYVPLYSPFLLSYAVIIFVTEYYKSIIYYFVAIANLLAVVILSTLRNGYPNTADGHWYPYLLILLGFCFITQVQRASSIDRSVRKGLIAASEKIEEERSQLNSLVNGIADSVIATDNNGNIIFFNDSVLKMFGLENINSNEPFSKIIRLYDNKNNLIDFFSLISVIKNQNNIKNIHLIDKDNEVVDLSVDMSKVSPEHGRPEEEGFIFLIRDITKEKSLDEQRDEFAAVTSHELRTPIAIAEANLSLAMDPRFIKDLDSASRSRLEQAHRSIIYLADLINQLAELSNIEKQDIRVSYEAVDVSKVLYQFQKDFKNNVDEKDLTLDVDLAKDLPTTLYTSKIYLIEIIENFLTNAVKYTKRGSITLRAENSQHVKGGVLFSVVDTGDGIGNLDKSRIFQKFYRAEDYRTKNTRGTGLGLYLTLKIAKFIKAKVWFTSELNQGSTFYVDVPPADIQTTNNTDSPSSPSATQDGDK